jgi:quercetin dioxygenase-like cupin family protein
MFIDHQTKSGIPMLESQDGLCKLAIVGPLNLVDVFQWYDFHAKPKGVLESSPHPQGTVEHLYIVSGELEVTTGNETKIGKAGEALRYKADVPHKIMNIGSGAAHAVMMLALRQLGSALAAHEHLRGGLLQAHPLLGLSCDWRFRNL